MKYMSNSTPVDYTLPDLYQAQRWMCSKCGLIFDNLFEDEGPGWPKLVPMDYEESEYIAICPRCDVNFESTPLIPVKVSEFDAKPYTRITFIVEDTAHKNVIASIAEKLKKRIDVDIAGNADKVKTLFDVHKNRNLLKNAYFLIDGDNKPRQYPQEERFIQLEKYCIENYLLDYQICAAVVNKTSDEVKETILKIIRKQIMFGNNIFAVLANMLTTEHLTEETVSQLDAAGILKELCKGWSLGLEEYTKKYVQMCFKESREEKVLPYKVLDVIKGAQENLQ